MTLHEDFLNPPSLYRSAPFWSWNDKLTDEELVRQIRAFHEQGIGGFFMHSRVGLLTDYLSDEWMDRVETCVEEARKLGMKAWLYDEDSYPSGYAGGFVPKISPDYRAKGLAMQRLAKGDPAPDNTLATSPLDGDEVAAFHVVQARDDTWFNGYSYIDTCNPDAVEAFIDITHEAYRKRFGDDFGGVIPGIFTDEPQGSAAGCPGPCLPWTDRFPEHFRERKGYDILDCLPALFVDTDGGAKARLDFWDVHTQLFSEVFCKRIYDWCEDNGLMLTGHFWEHTFPSTTHTGSTMPHYEYMQMPGIDLLFNQYGYERPNRQGRQFGNVMIVREVGSVAHQLGRKQVLSETYGGAGWELTFQDQKRIGDWEFCLGVTLLCQHLSLMSLRGRRKRDYPPSFLPHQPWWGQYRLLGDYFGRLGFMLSQGEAVTDVLVLHPYHSIWALTGGAGADPQVHEISRAFIELNDIVAQIHRSFDLGDETLIAKHGQVDGAAFVVGQARYRAVVVPPCLLLRATTLALLEQFVANGGKVVFVEPAPARVDAEPNSRLGALLEHEGPTHVVLDKEDLRGALADVEPDIALSDEAENVYYQHRVVDGRHVVFLSNVDDERGYDLTVGLPPCQRAAQWSLIDGSIEDMPAKQADGRTVVELHLPPVGSAMLVTDGDEPAAPARPRLHVAERITLDPMAAAPNGPNSAILDHCQFKVGGGDWSDTTYVQAAYKAIREHYGLDFDNGNRGVQLWLASKSYQPLAGDTRVALRYTFTLDSEPDPLHFVTETPERFRIEVNGQPASPAGDYWLDPAFRKVDITGLAQAGVNEIVLACDDFDMGTEIEACYLVGEFAAGWDGGKIVLGPKPASVGLGDWCEQGYPFFVGSMVYQAEVALADLAPGERVCVGLDAWEGVVCRVSVNGRDAGPVAWPPYEVAVTDCVKPGANAVSIEVFNSPRNLLGPHHQRDYVPGLAAPPSFYDAKNWRDDYDLVPQGLMDAAWVERRTPVDRERGRR